MERGVWYCNCTDLLSNSSISAVAADNNAARSPLGDTFGPPTLGPPTVKSQSAFNSIATGLPPSGDERAGVCKITMNGTEMAQKRPQATMQAEGMRVSRGQPVAQRARHKQKQRLRVCEWGGCASERECGRTTGPRCSAASSSSDSTVLAGTVPVEAHADSAVLLLLWPELLDAAMRQPCGRGQVAGASLVPVDTRCNAAIPALSARNPVSTSSSSSSSSSRLPSMAAARSSPSGSNAAAGSGDLLPSTPPVAALPRKLAVCE